MRVLVCGGRNFDDRRRLFGFLNVAHALWEFDTVIHGGARGADALAGAWADFQKIPVEIFPADWAKHGKAAGPIRNLDMLEKGRPRLVIAFPGGVGTAHMLKLAREHNVEVYEP